MRRYYTQQSYLQLVSTIRALFGQYITLSSDFIAGFCGETEQQFQDTLFLINQVKYDNAFLFAYSLRQKTQADRKLVDNISREEKQERLKRMIKAYESHLPSIQAIEVGRLHLVLVYSQARQGQWKARTDTFKKVVITNQTCLLSSQGLHLAPSQRHTLMQQLYTLQQQNNIHNQYNQQDEQIKIGDFLVTYIRDYNSRTLFGVAVFKSSITEFGRLSNHKPFF